MSDDDVRTHLAQAAKLVDALPSMTRALERDARADSGGDEDGLRAILDAYTRAVRALRAVALDARARIERTGTVITEAHDVVRRRRRRLNKIAARRGAESEAGPR